MSAQTKPREKKPKVVINRETSEAYRLRCIEEGLCTSCGNEPARQGRRLGEICTKKRSDEGKRRRERRGSLHPAAS